MKDGDQHKADEALLKLIKQGNRLAFNRLYDLYWTELFNYSYKILTSKDVAQDVVQDVFLKIWVNKNELNIKNLKSYLYNAARNTSISKIRKANFTEIHLEVIENLSIEPFAEQKINVEDLRKELDLATEGLPARCRQIFYLSRISNYTIDEIALELNISRRTVENQISIALRHVRPHIKESILAVLLCLTQIN